MSGRYSFVRKESSLLKGFGFVTFLAKKDALEAKRRMDREIVDGRRLVVRDDSLSSFLSSPLRSSGQFRQTQTEEFVNIERFSSFQDESLHLVRLFCFVSTENIWIFSRKTNSSTSERTARSTTSQYPSLGFSTPPTARRQHLAGFSSLSSTPTRANNYQRYYL